jgi:hypothetical protein
MIDEDRIGVWLRAYEAMEDMSGIMAASMEGGSLNDMASEAFHERFGRLLSSVSNMGSSEREIFLQTVVHNASIFWRILSGEKIDRDVVAEAFALSLAVAETLLGKGPDKEENE